MIQNTLVKNHIEPIKKNKGAAMKIVVPMFKGKADMKIVSNVVDEIIK